MYMLSFLYICNMNARFLICLFFVCKLLPCFPGVIYKWKIVNPTFDSIALRLETLNFYDDRKTEVGAIISGMDKIARQENNPVLKGRVLYWKASRYLSADKDSAFVLLNEALHFVDSVNYEYDYARMNFMKGGLLQQKGRWVAAYHIFKKGETYFKENEDYFHVAKVYVALGVLFNQLEEYENALKCLQEGEIYFRKADSESCVIKNRLNISNLLFRLGKQQESVKLLKSLLQDSVARQDTAFLISVMTSLVSASGFKENKYLFESYQLAKMIKEERLLGGILINLAGYYLEKKQNDSAYIYIQQAKIIKSKYKEVYDWLTILWGLAEVYENRQNLDSAYFYLKRYELYRDSLLSRNKIVQINMLAAQADIDKYEAELKAIQERGRNRTKMTLLWMSCLICFSGLVCWFLITLRKKEKIRRQLEEAENKKLNVQLQNEKLNIEKFQLEIDSKNREISSTTLMLAERNNVLKDILKQVEALGNEVTVKNKNWVALEKQIKNSVTIEDEWEYFKLHFEKVHPDYFALLKKASPSLSENDLRLCAYIRIGMTNKQIAQIFSVLPDTVNTARYRMRKKIGLKSEETLEDFLRNLPSFTPKIN